MAESIKVFAPATVANVNCGFDVLGFAVDQPGDELVLRRSEQKGIRISKITGDEGRLSTDPTKNTATVSILQYLQARGLDELGLEVELHKKMPFGSGLGSSAASTVAGVYAVNALLDSPLSSSELLPFAMEGERVACGAAHADNVGPSLLGGFVLIRSYEPLDVVQIAPPPGLWCAVIHPKIEINTKDAREILRKRVLMKEAVDQWGNLAGLIAGLYTADYALIGRSMQDVIVEPIRSVLIPGFSRVKASALDAGALGAGISGSGPSVFSLSADEATARKAATAMQEAFSEVGVANEAFISPVNTQGPLILD